MPVAADEVMDILFSLGLVEELAQECMKHHRLSDNERENLILAVQTSRLRLDCRACSDQEKIERGCEEDSPIPDIWTIPEHDMSFQRCPLKIITQQSLEYLAAYGRCEKWGMPQGSGWMRESTKLLHAMDVIRAECDRMEQEALR